MSEQGDVGSRMPNPSSCLSPPAASFLLPGFFLSLSRTLSLLAPRALSYFPVYLAVTHGPGKQPGPGNMLSISVPRSNCNTSSAPWLGGMWVYCVLTPASTSICGGTRWSLAVGRKEHYPGLSSLPDYGKKMVFGSLCPVEGPGLCLKPSWVPYYSSWYSGVGGLRHGYRASRKGY